MADRKLTSEEWKQLRANSKHRVSELVEGALAASVASRLASALGVSMPITDAVTANGSGTPNGPRGGLGTLPAPGPGCNAITPATAHPTMIPFIEQTSLFVTPPARTSHARRTLSSRGVRATTLDRKLLSGMAIYRLG